jgi:AAA15 family ATPase/GTPase
MLVSLSIGNFLSFKEIQTLDLTADSLKELQENLHIPYLYNEEQRLLKSVAIYGHNSHGKSNLVKGFLFLHNLIFTSFTSGQLKTQIDIETFALNTSMKGQPSFFEIVFLIRDTKYRYKLVLTSKEVLYEGLFYSQARIRENYLFERTFQDTKYSKQWNKENENRIEGLISFAKPHILLLSVLLSQENLITIDKIGNWLRNNVVIPDTYMSELKKAQSIYSSPDYTSLILKFINAADLGFTSIFDKLNKNSTLDKGLLNSVFEKEIKDFNLYTDHAVYNKEYKIVDRIEFELLKNESSGTIKYFVVACLLAYAIKNSQLIWIDELDARFHSFL